MDAYSPVIVTDMRRAIEALRDRPERLMRCVQALSIVLPPVSVHQQLRKLARVGSWPCPPIAGRSGISGATGRGERTRRAGGCARMARPRCRRQGRAEAAGCIMFTFTGATGTS